MPGLAYNGPFLCKRDLNIKVQNEMYLPENADINWDVLNLPHQYLQPVGLVAVKHKACWPSQSAWMQKLKEEAQAKLLGLEQVGGSKAAAQLQGSNESEHDLAAMVLDFIENDSCCDMWETSDTENAASTLMKFCDRLESLTSSFTSRERELLSDLGRLVLSINEDTDLIHSSEASECRGSCTRRHVVNCLRTAGYNAAVCKSQWQNSGKVPGGEYEYIDVVFGGERGVEERLVVDIDFQAQFEIARPTDLYMAALNSLPTVFVGSTANLKQILEIMSEAAKCSLRQNSMHLPPWRTLDYMSAKWLSIYERNPISLHDCPPSSNLSIFQQRRSNGSVSATPELPRRCGDLLRRTKVSLLVEAKGSNLSSFNNHGKGRANLLRKRMGNWGI